MADKNRRVEYQRNRVLKGRYYFRFIDIRVDLTRA
jgi:hypothetical protein